VIVTDWVIVTGPKPAESSTMTSPPAIVWAIAAANDRHGAVIEQAATSLPWPETNVR
jgi:hypothetical protein